MSVLLRPRKFEPMLATEFGGTKRLVVELDVETDGSTTSVVSKALRRAGKEGVVDLGPGRFEGFTVDRKAEVSSRELGLTEVAGSIRCSGGPVLLRGLVIRPSSSEDPAVHARGGTVFLVDCEIHGRVDTGEGAKVFMRNCLVSGEGVAWTLDPECEGEAVACRFTGSPAGIFLGQGASCALYSCRVELCKGESANEPGAGIYASFADLHLQGVEFFGNEVGLYLKSCGETAVVACHFHGNTTAGLITEEAVANRALHISDCAFDAPGGACPSPLAFHGGSVHLVRTRALATEIALTTSQTSLRLEDCDLRAVQGPALDLQGGNLLSSNSRLESEKNAGVLTEGTTGEITGGSLRGTPPLLEKQPGALKTQKLEMPTAMPSAHSDPAPAETVTLEAALAFLDQIIGQTEAKKEFGRLIRLAFASRQRRLQNLPPGELNFSGVIVGPQGSGKAHAIKMFAEALLFLGELPAADVREVTLAEATSMAPGTVVQGILMVNSHTPDGLSLSSPGVMESLLQLARHAGGGCHVMLDGEKQSVQAVMRSRPDLAREFPLELSFQSFGPPELAALFAEHCKARGIRISLDAARALPVIMHGLYERLHRRFTDTGGIAELFEGAHRNYLERCAREGRFDLELERVDIVVSLDRATVSVLERSADLVAVCPSCGVENPWLPGLSPQIHCLQCGESFKARFGTMKNSSFFRRRKSKGLGVRSGAVAMRRTLTEALRPRR